MTSAAPLSIHGPAAPVLPLVLDSPHSGTVFPADFDAAVSEFELRDGEYCFVDELYLPASEHGVALIAARFPRTYLDPNRHAGDIDLDLLESGHWPHAHVPIVALTADVMTHHQETYHAAGMTGFVPKPFSPSQLLTEIVRIAG